MATTYDQTTKTFKEIEVNPVKSLDVYYVSTRQQSWKKQ